MHHSEVREGREGEQGGRWGTREQTGPRCFEEEKYSNFHFHSPPRMFSLYINITIFSAGGYNLKKKKAAAVPAVEKEIEPVFQQIVKVIEDARKNTYRAINFEMVRAYWNIGRIIVEQEQNGKVRADYGKSLIKGLSK